MARIRTIKPEFFRHADLYEAEVETQMPLRVAFAGLWTCCDREGRFRWKPKELKLDCLPFDEVDFSRVLDALCTRGFIVKYAVDGALFGCIPSWSRHQVINNRETESVLPGVDDGEVCSEESGTCTREARVNDATTTPLKHAQAEGKGREGEREGKGTQPTVAVCAPVPSTEAPRPKAAKAKPEAKTASTWAAYADAYGQRYAVAPVRNAKVNGQIAQLVQRLGEEEAPAVAAFYVGHSNAAYVRAGHAIDWLLRDAEKLRTEWATGRRVTQTQAIQADRTQANGDVWGKLIAEAEAAQ